MILSLGGILLPTATLSAQVILPEQRRLAIRQPTDLPPAPVLNLPPPRTVRDDVESVERPEIALTLDEAINGTLIRSEVVRVLTGFTASTSGRTVYDAAIANTNIDANRAAFDPTIALQQLWTQNDQPQVTIDPLDPTRALIRGLRTDTDFLSFNLSKRNQLGGTTTLDVRNNWNRRNSANFLLNPSEVGEADISYTQPFLRGAGLDVNRVPIVLARIGTEQSFFQYKNAVQTSVLGVIEAYWNLVFAKTDLWSREQQFKQAEFANERAEAQLVVGNADRGQAAQTRVALESFKAQIIAARASVLLREAALLNILGLPPCQDRRFIPVTPLVSQRLDVDWAAINQLAATQRPDIVELKLVLEADRQQILLADNNARAQLNGVARYGWNGIDGTLPGGFGIDSDESFPDWSLGVNFSVPLGLRGDRARLRQRRLLLQRDQANLDQALHATRHLLALSVRNLDQFYEQYRVFQAVRRAARENLEQQLAQFKGGLVDFIVVLQAITSWGDAVRSEAQSLTQYNIELSRLELQTGTILESHDIVFFEERFRAIGPLGRCGDQACYPRSQPATPSVSRYGGGDEPSEEQFDLEDPVGPDANPISPSEDDEGMINMDEPVEFENVDADGDGELSDDEINEILKDRSSRLNWRQWLRIGLR